MAKVATLVLLLAGAVASALVAIRLTAAAFGSSFSPFSYLGVPAGGVLSYALQQGRGHTHTAPVGGEPEHLVVVRQERQK